MNKPVANQSGTRQSALNLRRRSDLAAPPSKPGKLALAVSMAVGSMPALAAFNNQVDVFVRPGLDRSYGGIEGVLPFSQTGTSLTFADLKFKLGQSGSYEGNLGLGHRFLTDNKQWALGFYGAWDHRNSANSNAFNQITAGAEALSNNLDFRFNYYYPITDRALLNLGSNFGFQGFSIYQSGIWEEAMQGFDVEAGVLLPVSDKWETRAYAAYYNFEGKDIAPQMDGWRVRLEVRPTNNIAVSLSHQQDDMFKDQTSLELRYTFGKDGKSGIRSLKERMTSPWTRDIDIVVSTPQEGAANSDFGRVVTGLDGSVVHINSAYTGGSSNGSFERPYVSVAQCEAAVVDQGKCRMVGGSVSGALNTDVTGDYNLIRLWEGNSQGDGGYTPITLLNGQMLAGEPITARNIVFMHNDPTVVAYRAANGLPNWFVDPVDTSTAPVINGITNGGTSVQLGSNTSVLGIATTNGGIEGKYSAGKIDLMYNQVNNYYTGGGISIFNMNVDSTVRIMYNDITTGGGSATGIVLANIADGGSATMNTNIYRNNLWVDGGSSSGTGIALINAAIDSGTATMNTTIANNYINVMGDGGGSDGISGATGIAAVNTAKYYSGNTTANMTTGVFGNYLNVFGTNAATGIALLNISVDGSAVANQTSYIGNNNSDGFDGSTGIRVTGVNDATGISGLNFALGEATAGQNTWVYNNTLRVTDLAGLDSATGVALYNVAGMNGLANQNTFLSYNTINAVSNNGDAFGINANNAANNKYNSGVYTATRANQNIHSYADTINATSTSLFAHATGINLNNEGVAGNTGAAVRADQKLFATYSSITATGADGATGIRANNGGTYYAGGTAALNQGVYLWATDVTATANGVSGNATGVGLYNDGGTRITATQNFGMYQLDGVSSSITATANGSSGDAYGINAMNAATARGTATQNMGVYNSSITANTYYSTFGNAVGIAMSNSANASGFNATAHQHLNLDGASVAAISNGGEAIGIDMRNTGVGRYATGTATQSLWAYDTNVSANSLNAMATGVYASNFAPTASNTNGDGSVSVSAANQFVTFNGGLYGNTISATSQYYTAIGINAINLAQSQNQGNYSTAIATQEITLTGMSVTANGDGDTMGIRLSNAATGTYSADWATVTATQTVSLDNTSVSATSFAGNATGLAMYNNTYVPEQAGNAVHTATQTVTASNGSSISAQSTYGQYVAGVYAGNSASMSNNYTSGASSTANQYLTLNNSSVSASGSYYVAGIYALNNSSNYSSATQLITLNNSGVSASGSYGGPVFGVFASNTNGTGGTSIQTITLTGGSVYAVNSYNGAGIAVFNNGSTYGVASQILTATNGVNITAFGNYQAGVMASTVGSHNGGGSVIQMVTLVGNSITAPNDLATSFYAAGNTYQTGGVIGNTLIADTGVYMSTSGIPLQIVTVSGRNLSTTSTWVNNVGGGTCLGAPGECAP